MARITNLFKDKVYIFSSLREVYPSETELIKNIFNKEGFEEPSKVEFMSANLNNDLFLAENSQGKFCVKLSLDKQNSNLGKEFLILKDNLHRKISSFPLFYGVTDSFSPVEYSVCAYIPAPNLFDFSLQPIIESEEAIPYFFANLSRFSANSVKSSIFDHLNYYLSFDILKIPEVNPDWIKNHQAIKNIIKDQVLFLQKIIKEKLSKFTFSQNDFCHGNLNSSSILAFGEHLHAINYENSYRGDWVLELLCLKYELFYPNNFEKEILNKTESLLQTNFNNHKISEISDLVCYLNLLKLMVEYLTEVYVLKCAREHKILQCGIKLSKNYDHFYQLPDFDKKLKPIAEFFVESVI